MYKMRFVYISDNSQTDRRIHIDEYTDEMSGKIFCPEGHPMVAKRGNVKVHHFAHKSNCDCSCSDNKGDWHQEWQDRAKKEGQEVRFNIENSTLTSNTRCHIADICIQRDSITDPALPLDCKGYVIEIQHSNMDQKTMRERERFYTSQGYHLVWLFDTKLWSYHTIRKVKDTLTIRQKGGSAFPTFGAYSGAVTKIFDFGKKDLFLVTEQKGTTITGRILPMEEFDSKYLGTMSTEQDTRPFHHPL